MSIESFSEQLLADGTDTVEVGFADTQGVLRGKRIPVSQVPRVLKEGLPFCLGALAWDIQSVVFPTELVSWENGYPDAIAMPDVTSLRRVPWREGAALVLADVVDANHRPVPVSTRAVLKKLVARAAAVGLRPQIGAELEFHVLDEDWKPIYGGTQAYSLSHAGRLEPFFRDLRNKLDLFGVPVEASHSEYGPAQSEVNLVYTDALAAADNALLFKYAVKEVARVHGLRASFMAKPWDDQSGSGFHVHVSYTKLGDSQNIFVLEPSSGRHALAGLLETVVDFAALLAPTVNSFKRVREESFVPTTRSWGNDNRTAAVRSLLGHGQRSRIELRTGAADANPYLAIAAAVAGSLYGLEKHLEPPPGTQGNAARDASLGRLPTTLGRALVALEASPIAREFFDTSFLSHYLTTGRFELRVHEQVVTDWERTRYLENA